MDQRDQALLDKQLRWLKPSPRNDGTMMLAIVAVFFAGITLGGLLSEHQGAPLQLTSNDAAISTSSDAAPPVRQ